MKIKIEKENEPVTRKIGDLEPGDVFVWAEDPTKVSELTQIGPYWVVSNKKMTTVSANAPTSDSVVCFRPDTGLYGTFYTNELVVRMDAVLTIFGAQE